MGWSAIGGYELNGDLPMFWPETFGVPERGARKSY